MTPALSSRFRLRLRTGFLEGSAEVLRGDSDDGVPGQLAARISASSATFAPIATCPNPPTSSRRVLRTRPQQQRLKLPDEICIAETRHSAWKPLRALLQIPSCSAPSLFSGAGVTSSLLLVRLFQTQHLFGMYSSANTASNRR